MQRKRQKQRSSLLQMAISVTGTDDVRRLGRTRRSDAIDYTVCAVYDAQLAVLNALDIYADEQAKIDGL